VVSVVTLTFQGVPFEFDEPAESGEVIYLINNPYRKDREYRGLCARMFGWRFLRQADLTGARMELIQQLSNLERRL